MMMKKLYKLSLTAFALLLCTSLALAQERTVSGTVSDESGQPLPGVNVLLKGTSQGTVTDTNGSYSINGVDGNSTLVFSFIGYVAKEVVVGAQTTINVALDPDVKSLEEVVVIGYGEQKKALVTGAISSVKADELTTVSVPTVDQALQGRTAGVQIVPNSGSPGAASKIRIRGVGSNGKADPLFIVDGIRSSLEGMQFLNPNDIESIEVLKDAASTAIYGAEGGNGVIIVTTKRGKAGSSEVSASAQYGVQSLRPNMIKMMNARQYVMYLEEAQTDGRPSQADISDQEGTDWLDVAFDNAPFQNYNVNFSNGTDRSNVFLSAGYFSQEGIAGGDKAKFDRYTMRLNTSFKLKEWLSVGQNMSFIHFNRTGVSEDSEYGSVVGSALSLDPLTPEVYSGALPDHVQTALNDGRTLHKNENGQYYGISKWVTGEFGNPQVAYLINKGKYRENKVIGNVYLELKPIEHLKFTSRFSVDAAFGRRHEWFPTYYYSVERLNSAATAADNWNEWFTTNWENFATYDRTIGDHHVTATAGTGLQKYISNYAGTQYDGLFREEEKWSYASDASRTSDNVYGTSGAESLVSFFGRLSYDFKDKYLFTATVRRDGSSKLAEGNQWGVFPSVSAGWVLSNEEFYQNLGGISNTLSFFKLRGSWGENGYLSNIYPGAWLNVVGTFINGPIRYANDNNVYLVGAAPRNAKNPDLTWETSRQLDIGADMRLLNDKLTFTVDYFKKTTLDLITPGSPPFPTGTTIPFYNAGTVVNKGFEFELGYSSTLDGTGFSYDVSANFTTLKNEVTDLYPTATAPQGANVGTHWSNATRFEEGEPMWHFYGWKTAGIFQTEEEVNTYKDEFEVGSGYDPQPGDPIFVDVNGDKIIDLEDRTNIGNPIPKFTYGGRINLKFKGFDLLMFLQGQSGNKVMMGFFRTDRATANKPEFFFMDRWTGEGTTNSFFRATTGGTTYRSDMMIQDGSFARIRQLQLGYTLPSAVSSSIGVKNLRFYVSLDNYFTFTKYKGVDPEAGSNNYNSIGIDRGVYPIPRKVLGGLSLTF